MTRPRLMFPLVCALFFFSGSAGLGYQMVWSRMFATGLGHEMPSVLAVVFAFMGGMALGAGTLDGRISRSRRPWLWYGWLEMLIGLWGLVSSALIPIANLSAPHLIGLQPSPLRHWVVAFALPFLALLPATAAMGATLPAIERCAAPLVANGRCVGALYAANTLGAVAGILAGTFAIAPSLGLRHCSWLIAGINLFCGAAALIIGARRPLAAAAEPDTFSDESGRFIARTDAVREDTGAPGIVPEASRLRLCITVFFTGMLGIGYETVCVRVLAQVLENTVYTFAAVLAVFLFGTSVGAALYQRFGRRLSMNLPLSRPSDPLSPLEGERDGVRGPHAGSSLPGAQKAREILTPSLLLTDLLGAVSLACLLGVMTASRAQSVYHHCRAVLGDGNLSVLAAEMTVASAVLLLPTIFMGAIFSHLVQAAARKVRQASRLPCASLSPASIPARASSLIQPSSVRAGGTPAPPFVRPAKGGVGLAAALNSFGGALATALFGVFSLSLIGSKWTLVLISFGYLCLLPKMAGWRRGFWAAAIMLMLALPANLRIVKVPPGSHVVDYREGVMASVAVVEDAHRDRVLRVDNRFQMGGTAAAAAEYLQAHIPLLLHPAPKRALFLGLGTGITFGAAALHPNLQADGVELVPEIVEVMPLFEPANFAPDRQPRLKLFIGDARRFVRASSARYDVIVADLFHPARDGAGSLYTLEHFRAVRERLDSGGLFCQWLPLHQLDQDMLRVIIRTFLEAFPDAQAWLLRFNVDAPALGLMGTVVPPHYSARWVEQRLSDRDLEAQLKKLALADSIRLFGNLLAGPKALRDFASDAPLNMDDRPRVTFGAPQFVYQKTATPYGRLLQLLQLGVPDPRGLLGLGPGDDANRFAARLTKYLAARDVYLKGLVEEAEGEENKAIDRFVESSRLSDDFTTGYAQCLSLASVWAQTKPAAARALLQRLAEAQPSRPVAKEMLERLFGK